MVQGKRREEHPLCFEEVKLIISSCLLAGVFPGLFKDFLGMELKNEEALKDYARNLADVFVNAIIQS